MTSHLFRTLFSVFLSMLCLGLIPGCHLLFGDIELDESLLEAPAKCAEEEYRCNGEYLLACNAAAGWVHSNTCATAERCDSRNKQCRVCNDGDFRCDGASRQACKTDNSGWREVERCESAELCSPTSCGPCTPGEFQCAGMDNRELRECGADRKWKVVDVCATESLCAISVDEARTNPAWSRTCEMPGCPEPGKYQCEGPRLLRCPQDQSRWMEVDVCPTPALCAIGATNANAAPPADGATVDMCPEGCPSAGAFFCDGMNLQRCSDDLTAWETQKTCEAGTECNPAVGDCTGLCTPGEYQCNGAALRRCSPAQRWEVVQMCGSAALCTAAQEASGQWTGSCRPPACPRAGDFRCDGAQLLECSDDLTQWEQRETCESAALCNALSRRCDPVRCERGALQCFGQELRQCNDSLTGWANFRNAPTPTVCRADQICDPNPGDPGCKTECPAELQCNGAVLQRCSPSGGWTTEATCASAALCQCALTDPDGPGPRTNSCTLGVLPNGCGSPVCGGPTGPNFQCSGATLQMCQLGRNGWQPLATCESAAQCYAGTPPNFVTGGTCLACPLAGEVQCTPTATRQLRACSNDRTRWTVTQNCQLDCVNSGTNDYCAQCNAGDAQCSGATLQVCGTDRRWVSQSCTSAALCDRANRQCDNCVANSASCNGLILTRCSADGQTRQMQTCANVCDAAGGQCDDCMAGSAWCEGATLFQCSADGQTQEEMLCATAALCDAEEETCREPECAVGDRRCTATGQPQVCNAGRTDFENSGMACATPQLCSNGACSPPACEVGARTCEGAQPVVCNAGRTEFEPTGSACASAALCNSTTGMCTTQTCLPMQRTCSTGNQPVICNEDLDGWDPVGMPCDPATETCDPATGTCRTTVCGPNDRRCMGAQPQRCNAARDGWVNDGAACATTALCNMETRTCDEPACEPGAVCTGRFLDVCNAGRTATTRTDCLRPDLCNEELGRCDPAECTPDAAECVGATLRTCNPTGMWTTQDCAPGVCDATGRDCDDCAPGTTMPSCAADGRVQSCSATGDWVYTTCVEPNVCTDGVCAAPPAP